MNVHKRGNRNFLLYQFPCIQFQVNVYLYRCMYIQKRGTSNCGINSSQSLRRCSETVRRDAFSKRSANNYPLRFSERKLPWALLLFLSLSFYACDIHGPRREIVKCDCFADIPVSAPSFENDGNSDGLRNIVYSCFRFPLF